MKRFLTIVAASIALSMSMTAAVAVTSGTFSALTLSESGVNRGKLSNNSIKKQTPANSGDRARWEGTLVDLNSSDKDDAYGTVTWWANGNKCYISGVTTEGMSWACQSGWGAASEIDRLTGTSDVKGVARAANFYYGGTDASVRVGIKVCRDRGRLVADPCTAWISPGRDYR